MHLKQTVNLAQLTAVVQAFCCRTMDVRREHFHTAVVGQIWKASAEMHRGCCYQAPIYSDTGRVSSWFSDGQLGKYVRLRAEAADLRQRLTVFVWANSATPLLARQGKHIETGLFYISSAWLIFFYSRFLCKHIVCKKHWTKVCSLWSKPVWQRVWVADVAYNRGIGHGKEFLITALKLFEYVYYICGLDLTTDTPSCLSLLFSCHIACLPFSHTALFHNVTFVFPIMASPFLHILY